MFKLTYGQVNHPSFYPAMGVVMACRAFPVKTAYNVAKVGEKLQREKAIMSDLYKKIADEFCDKDDKGNPMFHPMTGEPCVPADKKEAFEAKFKEFCDIEFELSYSKITMADLEKVNGLSPQQLLALEPVIAQLSVAPAAEVASA